MDFFCHMSAIHLQMNSVQNPKRRPFIIFIQIMDHANYAIHQVLGLKHHGLHDHDTSIVSLFIRLPRRSFLIRLRR